MTVTARTHYTELGADVWVEWNGDGTYTPRCDRCDYTGKPRAIHSHARRALSNHIQMKKHKEVARGR